MYPLLNQALRHEEHTQTANRNCQVPGARECSVQFPSVTGSGKQLKASTVHESDFRIREYHHVENVEKPSESTWS